MKPKNQLEVNQKNYYQRGPKKGLLKEKFLDEKYIDWQGTRWENAHGVLY